MKLIRVRRNGYALLFAVSICLTVWLGVALMPEAAFAFGAISAASLLLMVKQSHLLYDATLIWDNRILAVPSTLIFTASRQGKNCTEETVVSTFGLLIGSKIYQWDLDGVHSVRLNVVEIDKERMYITFGDAAQTMRVEMLHGFTKR
ncbi:MAG: hypothetical protein PHC69_05415 [Ruminiclostridium sp.]|nr:hypothetical protein [Ruminiclostridium sp.]